MKARDVMRGVEGERIGVVGLGHVGLQVVLSMSKMFETVGFDIDSSRVAALRQGYDVSLEVTASELVASKATFTTEANALTTCTFIIVAVPTPVDEHERPDLAALSAATELVGSQLRTGTVVVYESTVYPGLTETYCGPLLERVSGLCLGRDIFLAYSPERINPGDRSHGFERVTKVVAAQDEQTLQRVANVYAAVIEAGVHRAPSIAVAEASKLLENTQRDVNIALMNQFALVFDRIGLRTADVLAAARTKWNFLNFEPGLVGGQCVGVAPLYFSALAAKHDYCTDVVLAARHTNDRMPEFIAHKVVSFLSERDIPFGQAKVGVLGISFKENVADVRSSAVPRMLEALVRAGIRPLVHEPLADRRSVQQACGVEPSQFEVLKGLDVLVYAVKHRFYDEYDLALRVTRNGLFVDVKSQCDPEAIRAKGVDYWSL